MCQLFRFARFILLLPFVFEGIQCLRMMAMQVPEVAFPGGRIKLAVEYKLEGDQLYSIKWYKDDMEFYRFVPRDKPAVQFFPLEGLRVDMVRSVNGTVYIKDVDFATAGLYRVEVSADAPSFQTISASKNLIVEQSKDKDQQASSANHLRKFAFFLTVLLSLVAC